MPYKMKKLPSFNKSALEADANLYALSPQAADKYFENYTQKIERIKENPYMYRVFEDEPYFRSAGLAYGYRLFYHVDEQNKTVTLHRVIHGVMDLIKQLQMEMSD